MRRLAITACLLALFIPAACSTKADHSLSCSSTEVAPSSQPGSATPEAAMHWYVKNGQSGLPDHGFTVTGRAKTRVVYSDGTNQLSVVALPADKGKPRLWVVTMTFDCE